MSPPELKLKNRPLPHWLLSCMIVAPLVTGAFFFLCLWGFLHYVNFFPSPLWSTISIWVSVILAFIWAVLFYRPTTVDRKAVFYVTTYTLLGIFWGYLFLGYGIGPAMNYFSSDLITKDITGKLSRMGTMRTAEDYYIITPDLPQGAFARLYITEDEFNDHMLIDRVRMHVILKRSLFGMAVKNYEFLPLNEHTKH